MLLYRLILCFFIDCQTLIWRVCQDEGTCSGRVTRLETIAFCTVHQVDVHLKHLEDRKVKDKTKKKSVSNV